MFSLSVAWRFLSRNRAQTLLIGAGIAVGVGVLIFVGSLLQGLRNDLIETTIGSSPHVVVRHENRFERFRDDGVLEALDALDAGIRVVNPVLEGAANILSDEGNDPVILRGFDFARAEGMYRFGERLVEGVLPQSVDEIAVGVDLFEALALEIGATIEVFITERFETRSFKVVGVFDFSVATINSSWVIGDIDAARVWFDEQGLSAVEMQLEDVFESKETAALASGALGEGFRIDEWQAGNQELLSGLEGQAISGVMIQSFVLVSVVLGIASVLAISVLQKSRQLGILKAMGVMPTQARLIFLLQGLILGVFGAVVGVGLGLGLSWSFTTFALTPDGDPILAIEFAWDIVVISVFVSLLACLAAALIPARKSAKLSVIEVIRNG